MTTKKDIAIRVSGLLQAIIASGTPQERWEEELRQAIILHDRWCRKIQELLGGSNGKTEERRE